MKAALSLCCSMVLRAAARPLSIFTAFHMRWHREKPLWCLYPKSPSHRQLIDRFKTVFGNKVAALHSRMSEGERYDAWRSILQGKASLVIGARSAIFSPLDNIGLIIVDEEHETSYKQESPSPRYNAGMRPLSGLLIQKPQLY